MNISPLVKILQESIEHPDHRSDATKDLRQAKTEPLLLYFRNGIKGQMPQFKNSDKEL